MALRFDEQFFRLISDGDKIVLVRGDGKDRECYMLNRPLLTRFSLSEECPVYDVHAFGDEFPQHIGGLSTFALDISFRGGEVRHVDKPLVMGVDIFDKLTVSDYLDVINRKIMAR